MGWEEVEDGGEEDGEILGETRTRKKGGERRRRGERAGNYEGSNLHASTGEREEKAKVLEDEMTKVAGKEEDVEEEEEKKERDVEEEERLNRHITTKNP